MYICLYPGLERNRVSATDKLHFKTDFKKYFFKKVGVFNLQAMLAEGYFRGVVQGSAHCDVLPVMCR